MQCYIVFEDIRSKNLTVAKLQTLVNKQSSVVAFNNKERAKTYATSLRRKNKQGTKVYVLRTQMDGKVLKGAFEAIIPMKGAWRVFPAKRKIVVKNELVAKEYNIESDIENFDDSEVISDNGLDNEPQEENVSKKAKIKKLPQKTVRKEKQTKQKAKNKQIDQVEQENQEDQEGEAILKKIVMGAIKSMAIGTILFIFEAFSVSSVANFASIHGLSMFVANVLVYGAAGMGGAAILSIAYYIFQVIDDSILGDNLLDKTDYLKAVEKESNTVAKLRKNIKNGQSAKIFKKFDELLQSAKLRKFDKEGEAQNQDKQPKIDKLLVLKWEHKKLEKLSAIKNKNIKAKYESKILKKMKTKRFS